MIRPRLVLISIDGLSPDAYLERSEHWSFPRSLAAKGAFASSAVPVYPSVTYTVHASIATGCLPSRHGIPANTRFTPQSVRNWQGGESKDWFFDARNFQSPPLWEIAEKMALSVALLRWPSTKGACARFLVPEIFSPRKNGEDATWPLIKKLSTPELISKLESFPDFRRFRVVPPTYPGALCSIEAEPGLTFGQCLQGEDIEKLSHIKADHGYKASDPAMRAGLIVLGPGISPGLSLGTIPLLDIAPTCARLLGLPPQAFDGKPIAPLLRASGRRFT